jgi:hypothetical protein
MILSRVEGNKSKAAEKSGHKNNAAPKRGAFQN